ncbi:Armadillo repeat protein deleted in velo-cardio-facial syndrome [Triplophysa tibetana]|uniref:Armadillo repeat protein deleted in velo-cardio-facial syndrome n=1 Tax=Triplophysa tibetana TaxID=1572043 RepID=A0A5A9P502_9TELE|nr:Armadillo repeat protein deleted in velo-cardio-facial syndrome [Triplophysa tibetana]
MEDYDVPSAASILASVKEQEARFERLTRALEEERRNVSVQLERGSLPSDRLAGGTTGMSNQPLAWQQMVMQRVSGQKERRKQLSLYGYVPCYGAKPGRPVIL